MKQSPRRIDAQPDARARHTSRVRAGAAADPKQETTMLSPRLHHFLDERHAAYTTLSHERTVTAQETANSAHIGNRHFAKTVMLKVGGDLAMMVMPAAYRIDLTRLSRALGGREVELAQEPEFSDAFPDCELGAMPPFGNLYDMPVYVDARLSEHPEIAFNAGSHTELMQMPYAEFEQLVKPEPLWLAHVM
ncbi:aminoacyl-tRNA deacylase [Luteimonas soli]|uniref:Aminoacyl-tRNA deacylase n=1 Tax=Luteimonas soli TaxID=1648966 RepID=A0ABV7XK49_9GAMM